MPVYGSGRVLCPCRCSDRGKRTPLPPVYHMLLFITPWYIVYVFIEVLGGSLRGRGNVIVPVVITLLGVCVLRIIWLAGVLRISPTIHAIIFSYPVTWVITALAFIGYYLWKDRQKLKVSWKDRQKLKVSL